MYSRYVCHLLRRIVFSSYAHVLQLTVGVGNVLNKELLCCTYTLREEIVITWSLGKVQKWPIACVLMFDREVH